MIHRETTWSLLKRAFWRGVFPHQLSWFLELPGRGLIMSAETVAARLPVTPDGAVLEIGPGSGYYSVAAARRVPRGALTLADIQPGMLAKCTSKLERAGIANFRTALVTGDGLPFENESFDAIFMVTVFGEIADRDALLAEAFRVTKPGGAIAVTEHHPDPDFEPHDVVARCLAQHGFVPERKQGWRWAYTLTARKAPPRSRPASVAGAHTCPQSGGPFGGAGAHT